MPIIKNVALPQRSPNPLQSLRRSRQNERTNRSTAVKGIVVNPGEDIQYAIDSVSENGGGVVNLTPGTFYPVKNITVPSNVALVGDATTVIDFDGQAYQILIEGTDAYSTGTVAVNNDSTAVTGTGTAWTSAMEGQSILIGDFWYTIDTVNSTTSITLASIYAGSSVTGASYVIATTVNGAMLKGFIVQNSSIALIRWRYVNFITIDGVVALSGLVGWDGDDSAYMNLFNGTIDDCTTAATLDNCPFGTYFNQIVTNSGGIVADKISNWAIECFSLQNITGDAITISNSSNVGFVDFAIYEVSGDGINFLATNSDMQAAIGNIGNCTGNGIILTATNTRIVVLGCAFTDNTLYGVNVAASSNSNIVIASNTFTNNLSGQIYNVGTNTKIGDDNTGSEAANATARAYLSADQSINDATETKVLLDTEVYDPGSDFDNATNYRYVAPISGKYFVVASARFEALGDGIAFTVYIYKNGTVDSILPSVTGSATSSQGSYLSNIIDMAAGDYVELYARQDSGGAKNVKSGASQTFLSISRLGS